MRLTRPARIHGFERPLIGARRDGADGADHAHPSRVGGSQGGPQAGFDHADDRHLGRRVQTVEAGGGRRVARHHQQLDVVVLDQLGRDLPGKPAHLVQGARAIGIPAGVADIDEVLGGQQIDDGPGDGETAETAVEHADRPVVHGWAPAYRPRPAAPGSRCGERRATSIL